MSEGDLYVMGGVRGMDEEWIMRADVSQDMDVGCGEAHAMKRKMLWPRLPAGMWAFQELFSCAGRESND